MKSATVEIKVSDLRKIEAALYTSKQTKANDAIYLKVRDMLAAEVSKDVERGGK